MMHRGYPLQFVDCNPPTADAVPPPFTKRAFKHHRRGQDAVLHTATNIEWWIIVLTNKYQKFVVILQRTAEDTTPYINLQKFSKKGAKRIRPQWLQRNISKISTEIYIEEKATEICRLLSLFLMRMTHPQGIYITALRSNALRGGFTHFNKSPDGIKQNHKPGKLYLVHYISSSEYRPKWSEGYIPSTSLSIIFWHKGFTSLLQNI